ncbi:RidA family protein [Cellulomonas fimi]|uniref:Endoribonuclease L-PSP n=1 Tax=Cellulomonas fimi (strain ATCC 484 / DSM 20113 / JCM 1341 / CCUG 24087 / LMG 16345 / NBRC 15513 / NCIMB 8980 / NCTC 7547 / NRS-133) TaxID=590998 RepID=F4GZT6_CELFA|nr:Rid family hydrolase [Cellulomonas fimi]AEE47252.1 Endoribonuclease L-PSP [Cellulomonas fimi ATCC 484]NNH06967.1 RidA family protein [Cellulomonas fimi]VEH35726.1 Endoribonuclease L-PSP [Cellulomonas fimi]
MTVQLLSPAGLADGTPYHHVAIATGSRHVHVAGQVAGGPGVDRAPDLAGQVAQALRNTARGLAGAGATFDDVVRLTFYVTRWTPEQIGELMSGVESVAGELDLPSPLPPSSLIGVEVLYEPDVRVEVEATAVLG